MKKLLVILSSISVASFSVSNVIACSRPTLFNKYTEEEKILSIRNLTSSLLTNNGVKVGNSLTEGEINTLISRLNLDKILDEDEYSRLSPELINVYIMGNSLLNEISTKVPGYEWISSKIAWQSQWSLRDLFQEKEWGIANNVSGWMDQRFQFNGWSLSITFLDEKGLGWTGEGNPQYARININKRLVADKDGNIITEESNPDAIREASINALEPIFDSKRAIGPIYNGYASSSNLISLKNVFEYANNGLNPGFVNYSPSVMDLINNLPMNFDFGNDVLKRSQEKIEKNLNDYLKNNPIYLSSSSVVKDINIIFRNQIYSTLFSEALDRRNFVNENGQHYSKEQMYVASKYMKKLFSDLNETLNTILQSSWVQSNVESKTFIENFISESKTNMSIDAKEPGLDSGKISQFKSNLLKSIELSRNIYDPNSSQIDFAKTMLVMVNNKEVSNANFETEGEPENPTIPGLESNLKTVDDYRNFGYDNFYKLISTYYSEKVPRGEELDFYKFNPDKNTSLDKQFNTDIYFKSVFFEDRFSDNGDSLFDKYNELVNKNNGYYNSFFNSGFLSNVNEANENVLFEEMSKLLGEITGLDEPSNSNPYDWRVYLLNDVYMKKTTENLYNTLADSNNFHNFGISLDKSRNSTPVTDSKNLDDDNAFAELIKYNELSFALTDINNNNESSSFSSRLYNYGTAGVFDGQEDVLYLYKTNVNIYGKNYNKSFVNENPLNKPELYFGAIKLFTKLSNLTNNFLSEYWNNYVKLNHKNPDYNIK
ncbi:hypothetical protein [Spiroplasma turonicum]|uniref:Lipoprotein n=1 Tax=Spiroplasma turonicum TaxID=216946 RepID=A0A0K1P6P1_9MOLU|nr:hypothetical protein [Spiroplasma turonicum]AKU79532.1 hypothetical protein STURON_00286 [Spiroplasma turonicum]ALX70555.1 hypothetical protein STURO_v1c02870 [Spiroplasma turonicum]